MSNPNGLIQKVACEVIRDRARAARLCLEHTGTTLGLSAFLPPRWGHFFDRAMGSIASLPSLRFNSAMPQDPFIREKFTKERTAARKHAAPLIRGDNLMSFLRNPPRPLAFGVEAAGGKNQNQKGVKQHG